MIKGLAITTLAAIAATPALADWNVDNSASRVSFVTTKAGQVAEVHRFHELAGSIGRDGAISITIDLASVDTLIPVRDERMREMLFETAQFPEAVLTGQLDMAAVDALSAGDTAELAVEAALQMRGQTLPITFSMLAAKLSDERLVVSSLQPVIVNAGQVGLAAGVEALREVAGLDAISPAVPVSVVLTFDEGM